MAQESIADIRPIEEPIHTTIPVVLTGYNVVTGLFFGEYRPSNPAGASRPVPTQDLPSLVFADLTDVDPELMGPNEPPTNPPGTEPEPPPFPEG